MSQNIVYDILTIVYNILTARARGKKIVYGILTAQARRIECGHCLKPFTCIHGVVASGEAARGPIWSSQVPRVEAAGKRALAHLPSIARKKQVGLALCPYCKRYQDWMVSQRLWNRVLSGLMLGALVSGIVMIVAHAFNDWRGSMERTALLSAIAGGLGFGLLGYVLTPRVGPHRDKAHPESMRDDELSQHLGSCNERGRDPFLAWLMVTRIDLDMKMPAVSLGLRDETRRPVLPIEISTSRILSQLREEIKAL